MARDRSLSRNASASRLAHSQTGSRNTTQSHPHSGGSGTTGNVIRAAKTLKPDTEAHVATQAATPTTARRGILSEKQKIRRQPARAGYYGPPKCSVGTMFESRLECSRAEVHNPTVAGISYSTDNKKRDANPGAYSIVLSGGYEDDVDAGYTIFYTGAGGQTNSYGESGGQVGDQSFQQPSNHALRLNLTSKNPVRVVRGSKSGSIWAPREGYRYDGLYNVTRYKIVKGKSGHKICMFKLTRMPDQKPLEDLKRTF